MIWRVTNLFVWARCVFCHVCSLEWHVSEQFRDAMVHHIILSHLDISEIMHWDDSLRAINLLFNALLMIMAVRDCRVLMPCFPLRNLTEVLCTCKAMIRCWSVSGVSETQVSQHCLVSAQESVLQVPSWLPCSMNQMTRERQRHQWSPPSSNTELGCVCCFS